MSRRADIIRKIAAGEIKAHSAVREECQRKLRSCNLDTPLSRKVKNASQAVIRTIRRPGKVSDEIYEERRAICAECEFLTEHKNRCLKCGCFLRLKARLKSESCPLKKWTATQGPDT